MGVTNISSWIYGMIFFSYVVGLSVKIIGIQIYIYPIIFLLLITFNRIGFKIFNFRYSLYSNFVILIFLFTLITNLVNGYFTIDYTVKQLLFVVTSIIITRRLINPEDLKIPIYLLLVAMTISSVVAFFQSIGSEWAINLWIIRFMNDSERSAHLIRSLLGGRCCGLSSYSINYGFQLVQTLPIAFYFTFKSKNKKSQLFFAMMSMIMFWGTIVSGCRAAVIVAVCEFLIVYSLAKHYSILKTIVVFMPFVLLFILLFNDSDAISRLETRFETDKGNNIRYATISYYYNEWLAGNPFQLLFGHGNKSMDDYRGIFVLGSGHNSILTVLFEFGFLGLILSSSLYYCILRKLWLYKNSEYSKVFVVGISGYLIMSLTNDSTLLSADLFHIFFMSMIILYINIIDKTRTALI